MRDRVDDRVVHGGCRSERRRLADPLGSERIVRARRLGVEHLVRGELRRRRHRVVHEVRRDRVAVLVVANLFEERLCNTLADTAVLLAGDEERVHDLAAVVDRDDPHELDPTGVGVDLDHRDVRAERERRAVGDVVELVPQAVEHVGRAAQRVFHGARELDPRQPARRHAGHFEAAAVADDDVVGARLEHVGRELLGLREHLLARTEQRAPADLQGAGAAGSAAPGHFGGVGVHDPDRFHRDTERVADDHGERRLVTLAVRARPDPSGHRAVGFDLDRSVLTVEGRAAR